MQYFDAVGRRKTAIGKVRISLGTGKRIVNDLNMKDYFERDILLQKIEQPLQLVELAEKFDIKATVKGGGKSAQADALKLAVAKALLEYDDALRGSLKKDGLLTRDSRIVERKVVGRPKARKKPQFSKR